MQKKPKTKQKANKQKNPEYSDEYWDIFVSWRFQCTVLFHHYEDKTVVQWP